MTEKTEVLIAKPVTSFQKDGFSSANMIVAGIRTPSEHQPWKREHYFQSLPDHTTPKLTEFSYTPGCGPIPLEKFRNMRVYPCKIDKMTEAEYFPDQSRAINGKAMVFVSHAHSIDGID